MSFWLVRHGETAEAATFLGWRDPAATPEALESFRALAHTFRPRPRHIFSSDLRRAHECARILADVWQVELRIDARLREMNFGEWAGLLPAEVERRWPCEFGEWMAAWRTRATPGGESFRAVQHRVADWLREARIEIDGHRDALVVAHAGSIRALLSVWMGAASGDPFGVPVPYATVLGPFAAIGHPANQIDIKT